MAKKGIVDIHGKQYKTVVLRVNEFRAECPIKDGWGIVTEIIELNETWACVQAIVVDPDERVVGCGHGIEFWQGSNKINKTSALENAETSAVGRALASIGLGGEEYASADEVLNAISTQKVMEAPEVVTTQGLEPPPEIIDDIDDLVSENYEILCNRLGKEKSIDWHKKVMENFFGGKKRSELDKVGLAQLADLQNQRIKNIGGDDE